MVRRGQGNELEGGESGIGEQKCGLVPRLIPSHQLLGGFRLPAWNASFLCRLCLW